MTRIEFERISQLWERCLLVCLLSTTYPLSKAHRRVSTRHKSKLQSDALISHWSFRSVRSSLCCLLSFLYFAGVVAITQSSGFEMNLSTERFVDSWWCLETVWDVNGFLMSMDEVSSSQQLQQLQQPHQHSPKAAYDFSDCVDKRLDLAAFSSAEPLNTFVFGPEKEVDVKEEQQQQPPKEPASKTSLDLTAKSVRPESSLHSVIHSFISIFIIIIDSFNKRRLLEHRRRLWRRQTRAESSHR